MQTPLEFDRGMKTERSNRAHPIPSTRTFDLSHPCEGPWVNTPLLLHHFFERSVDVRDDALPLVCGADLIRYADLEARANRLARRLARRSVRTGDRVGLLFERSVRLYVAL